jgi:hypothetical protein
MKIKCKVIIGIVLIAFILSIGIVYSQGSLYSDPQGRFSFNLPAGWKAGTPYDPSQAAYFTYSAPQGIIGELIIILEELPFNATIDQYVAAAEENGFSQLPGYKASTQLPSTVNGLPAIKKNFTFNSQANDLLQGEVYMFISDKTAYTLLLDVLPNNFSQLEPGFAQMMVNFSVQGGAPVTVQPVPVPQPTPTIPQPTPVAPTAPSTPIVPTPTQPTTTPTSPVCPTPQPTTPIVTTPVPTTPATPVQPPVATGMTVYVDPQGRFSIPIPAGSTTVQTTEMGIVLNTPGGAGIVVMYTLGEQYVQGMVTQIEPNHTFHGQSQLQAGNRPALIKLYSMINPQDNVNYATLVATYPNTPFMIIVTVPADKYEPSQSWIVEMIKGASIR